MNVLTEEIIRFFYRQPYTIITTVDKNGSPYNSCKGIVDINKDGKVYLLDLYRGQTYENLKKNPHITITAVNEHKFTGYSLRGKGSMINEKEVASHLVKAWEEKIIKRLSERLVKNLHGEKGHPKHPEALLPKPEYLIEVEVKEIIDLTPRHIRKEAK
ncbi:pyridoxamine 5'-phosphate oxidase family protein [Candidatus Omnitrophota bacterium]